MSSLNPKTYDTTPPMSVAFIGLGVMGFPMAGHLALAGHRVTVYNRNSAPACTHPTRSRARGRFGVLLCRQ
jgi:3-hydroxyacyl-CoA dehydrogenase